MTPETWKLWLPLIVVLGLSAALYWLAHRLQLSKRDDHSILKLRASLSLGPKERIAVIEIEGQWLVVGITPGKITPLHSLPASSLSHADAPQSADHDIQRPLANWLQQYIHNPR